jgi:hypothetical protein
VGIGELRGLLLADGRQGRHESPRGKVQDREGSQRAGALPVLHDGSEVLRAGVDRQVLSADEPGLVRGEERDRVCRLLRLHDRG